MMAKQAAVRRPVADALRCPGLFPPAASPRPLPPAPPGHLIYGPYVSGSLYTAGFDLCKGSFWDTTGNYGYFMTSTYPYTVGCFGPGSYPSYQPSCTTNAASTTYTKSATATAMSTTTTTSSSTTSSGSTTSVTTTSRRRGLLQVRLFAVARDA